MKKFKAKYSMTWPEAAKSLGISESWIRNWYTSNRPIPPQYDKLIHIFFENPEIFEKYKC